MIFIGGVSPKLTIIDPKPVICPVCGLAQAHYKRLDHYLNIFFIPVLRIRKGEPFLMCDRCERNVEEMGEEYQEFLDRQGRRCSNCNAALHPDFRYCPTCGKPVR